MSKELIDRLRIVGGVGDEAADTIERLETERDAAYKIADHYRAKRDELERELAASQKQNALLREALERHQELTRPIDTTTEALAATADLEGLVLCEGEPFGIWHVADTEDESDFFLASESGDVAEDCARCIKLYRAREQK